MDVKKFEEIARRRAENAKVLLESGLNDLAINEVRSLRTIAVEAYNKRLVSPEEFSEMDSIATRAVITVFPANF